VPATFQVLRVEQPGAVPQPDPHLVDVAVLDMHHGWPNLGHDAIIHALQNATSDLAAALASAGLGVRVLSYDVRRGLAIPAGPGAQHQLYVGTGGPGHLDPRQNDGVAPGSQGIAENPAWEAPLFRLFDLIAADGRAALLGVCHTFGVMCRWLHAAEPVMRGPNQGGKSSGVVENVLTDEGVGHPWFAKFSAELSDRRHFRVLDNRLFDLVLTRPMPAGVGAIAFEAARAGGPPGRAMTMMEVARDADGVMPRVFAVNHHPEIGDRPQQLVILQQKVERGDVTPEWYAERVKALTDPVPDETGDRLLNLTSSYTFIEPLRFHLARVVAPGS
jgi:hypothetical protein